MESFSFNLKPTVEQKPFESPAVRSFFQKWCEINDSITSEIISREEWEKRGEKDILERAPNGKQTLFLPEDLRLWEMAGVMEKIDRDTFADNPKKQNEKREEMRKLGRTFRNAGVYIAQRISSVHEGQEIARALAGEFYAYGESLLSGEKTEDDPVIDEIAGNVLSPEETEEADRFLAGEELYASRRARAEESAQEGQETESEGYEEERRKTLAQFFRVSEKAFRQSEPKADSFGERLASWFQSKIDSVTNKEQKRERRAEAEKSKAWEEYQKYIGKDVLSDKDREEKQKLEAVIFVRKPWKSGTPVHAAFLDTIGRAMEKQIETPKREFEGSFFRRGMELLRKNMLFDSLPQSVKDSVLHLEGEETALREALGIESLKTELEEVRQIGDIAAVSRKEGEITDKIQVAISSFPYKPFANNPSEMAANQDINCVGASMLGGTFLSEIGIKHAAGIVPEHSILVILRSDGKIEQRDMLSREDNEEIIDEAIEGKTRDGKPLTAGDVAAYINNPKPEGLMFDINGDGYRKKFPWVKKRQRQFLSVFPPEVGQKILVLNNTGHMLSDLGQRKEAIAAYRQAIAANPKYTAPYCGLGNELTASGQYEGAIKVFRQGIAVDSEDRFSYNGLGNALSGLGRNEEAIEAYRKAIAIDPQQAYPHYRLGTRLADLGYKKEAVKEYRKFISLADKRRDNLRIKEAEIKIARLLKNKG